MQRTLRGLKVRLIEGMRGLFAQGPGGLNLALRVSVLVLACILAGGLLFWLCNELLYFYVAKSYVEELADAYNLNRGLAQAILWASFAAIVVLAGYAFSFSKRKRRVGLAGLLVLVIGHSLFLAVVDPNFKKDGSGEKCYVMTRTAIKMLNRVGIDSETGRECRPLTAQIFEKIQEYRSGHRATQITSSNPIFFDATTGEPVVWYSKNDHGQIELFDLMGFNPQTDDELIPITREVVAVWKQQNAKVVRRAPQRVDDPEQFGFFEPTTGAAKVWFWRSESGVYEFYDGPGFHPQSGDQLRTVTREVISAWRQQQQAVAEKKKAEQEQKEREAREAAERDRQAQEAANEAELQRQQSGADCDRLAANPTDRKRTADGVSFEALKSQADPAFEACARAVATFPTELRYQYQLGRAAQFKDRKQAFEIFSRLVKQDYAAAFDNLGGIYQWDRKDLSTAIALFKRGAALDDADSMTSLVDLIDKGLVPLADPQRTKLSLLKRAAELGHASAQRAYDLELQKMNQERVNQANQQQMMQMFGAIVQGAMRH